MKFKEEGAFPVTIQEAFMANPKFSKEQGAFDIAIKVADDQGHEDYWRGEISSEWGKGNFSDQTQAQITMKQLQRLGWNHGVDFSKLDTLVGVQTVANVKAKEGNDGNTYYNITFLGEGGDNPQPLSDQEKQQKLAAAQKFFPNAEQPAAQPAQQPAQEPAQQPETQQTQQPAQQPAQQSNSGQQPSTDNQNPFL